MNTFNKDQLEAAYAAFNNTGGQIIEVKMAKPRKGEITFHLDKALYNRPERRGTVRRRNYLKTTERF